MNYIGASVAVKVMDAHDSWYGLEILKSDTSPGCVKMRIGDMNDSNAGPIVTVRGDLLVAAVLFIAENEESDNEDETAG